MSFVAGTDWLLAQIKVFAAALLGGAGLACCWGLYSGLYRPRTRRRRDWLLPDLLFSLAAAALLSSYWFAFTDGGLRPCDFLWLACGFLLFRLLPPLRLPALPRRLSRQDKPKAPARPRRSSREKTRRDPVLRTAVRLSAKAQDGGERLRHRLRQVRKNRAEEAEEEEDVAGKI